MRDVFVLGVGMTPFGRYADASFGDLAQCSSKEALADAGVRADDVDAVYVANAAEGVLTGQEMIRGQVALRGTGLSSRVAANVENACASGSTAAHLAWLSVASGQHDVVMSIGAERLSHPDKARSFAAIEAGTDRSIDLGKPTGSGSVMMKAYADAARSYNDRHPSIDMEPILAAICVKNRDHALKNPLAQFRDPISVDDVLAGRIVADPLRLLMCSPITDGSASIVFASKPPSSAPALRIASTVVGSYGREPSVIQHTSSLALHKSDLKAREIDVFALHDATAFSELLQYEEIGLFKPGEAHEALSAGEFSLGGQWPVNTDGGLLSRGHPLGATGLAQLRELVVQLRHTADSRQVVGARSALAVNAGGWMGDDYAVTVATVVVRD